MQAGYLKVITTHGIRQFIAAGGTLGYEAEIVDGQRQWILYGIQHDGTRIPVIGARNSEPRVFKSANALVKYHEQMCPNDGGVTIPFQPTGLNPKL